MKKGKEIIPPDQFKLTNEDRYTPKTGDSSSKQTMDFGKKNANMKPETSNTIDDSDLPDNKFIGGVFREASQTIVGKGVELSDFLIKKVIGRGSFGKVFLVEN